MSVNVIRDNRQAIDYHYRMAITNIDSINRNFFLGFIRLHILFHATQEPIFGLDMIRELEGHAYSLSPGTLYPILHNLERDGLLETQKQVVGGKVRKYYHTTETGRQALSIALEKVHELINEIDPDTGEK